jgi:hypothetical protein
MTREQIEEWMRLSGADFPHMASLNRDLFQVFARFAEYATQYEADRIADESKHIIKRAEQRGAKIERETCAQIADEWCTPEQKQFGNGGPGAAIRARGEK